MASIRLTTREAAALGIGKAAPKPRKKITVRQIAIPEQSANRNELLLWLRLPSACLSPNSRAHFMRVARAKKSHRREACIMAKMVRRFDEPTWERAEIHSTFYWPTNASHDLDNSISSCKAIFDGLADGGVIWNDRGFIPLPPIFEVDPLSPRLQLLIRKIS